MGLYMTEEIETKIKEKIKREFPRTCISISCISVSNESYSFDPFISNFEANITLTGCTNDLIKDLDNHYHTFTLTPIGKQANIKSVVFHDPATIVYWTDGTKTVVKCSEDEPFDPEKGLAMAISKKFFGNQGNYYNEFKKWLPEPDPEYEEFCKFEEGVRRTNPTWSDSLKALSDAIKKANLPKSFTDALFFGGKYRKCNTCEYQAAAFNPCNGCKDGSEYKEVKTDDNIQL